MSRPRKKRRCVECKRIYGRRTQRRLDGRYCSSVCRDAAAVRKGLEDVEQREVNRKLLVAGFSSIFMIPSRDVFVGKDRNRGKTRGARLDTVGIDDIDKNNDPA